MCLILYFPISYNRMIYTYSPNWYKPQCLHFTDDNLYYCSNYILYHYYLPTKSIVRQKCFREIAMEYNLNHKDIKITSINSNQHQILIGINQPYLIILDAEKLLVERVISVPNFQSIDYIYQYKQNNTNYAILCNKDGHLLKYTIDQQKPAFNKIQMKHKLSAVKAIYSIDNMHCAVFTRGTMIIYSADFNKVEKLIQISASDTVYSVDCIRENERIYFAFLIKNKDAYTIIAFQYKFKEQFDLQHKRRIGQIGENIKKFTVNIYYPKKFTQKLKLNQKASLTIKLLSSNSIILTGKLGQIMTIYTQYLKQNEQISIKPYSYSEQQSKQYEVWPDSKHYKEIYFIYQHHQRLYIISTDHNLSIWQKKTEKEVKYIYTLKFLTASINSFFYAESDPKCIYSLLKDSVVRSFTPLEQGSHQLNEFWKFNKKFKIKKAVCHPYQQGILAFITQCNHIQIYDIFEDRLMKLIEIGVQTINLSFQMPNIVPQLEKLLKVEFKQEKFKTVSHFVKEIENKTVILIHTKDSYIIVSNLAQKQLQFWKAPKSKRIQRIHQNRYWDNESLLSSHSKNQILQISMLYQQKLLQIQIPLKYQQGRVLFKKPKGEHILNLFNFKGSKFTIYRVVIEPADQKMSLISSTQVCLQNPIDFLSINYFDWRVAVYCQRDDTFIVIHLDKLSQQRYEINKSTQIAQIYWINTKIDALMLYLKDHLIIATKDQNIKVIKYDELPQERKNIKKNGYITRIGEEVKQL